MTVDSENYGGCLTVIGIVIVSIAGGCIWGSAVGWLILGGTIVTFGIINKIKRRH